MFGQQEVDRFGNLCCGEDFMAGTICSDRPGHAGPHNCTCQNCGGDWYNETCTCPGTCYCCERNVETPYEWVLGQEEEVYEYCQECFDWGCGDPSAVCSIPEKREPSESEVDEALASIATSIRTLTTDNPPSAFSSPTGETEPTRKGQT